jgi:dipeptidyl aminopeptidase/acylaminoacyl peptidase
VNLLFRALAIAGALVSTTSFAAPLEAYGSLPNVQSVELSPSGHAVAMLVAEGEKRSVAVQDVATGELITALNANDTKIRSLLWAGDNHLVVVTSATAAPSGLIGARREWMMASAYDLKAGRARSLLAGVEDAEMNTIFGEPDVRTVDGATAVFVQGIRFKAGKGQRSLFRTNPATGSGRLVGSDVEGATDFIVGADGALVAYETYDPRSGRWRLRVKAKDGWRDAHEVTALLDPPNLVGLGRDGASVLFSERRGEEDVWREVDIASGSLRTETVFDDADSLIHDPFDGRLLGYVILKGDERTNVFFDPADHRLWGLVLKAFPGQRVSLTSWSADRRKMVVLVDSPTEGPAYALVDLRTGKASWLAASHRSLRPEDISPKTPISFKAADGLPLTGYLTTPYGRPARNLPLVVLPHGGPASRDTLAFDWWGQAIASRGYAVLQVNFRGSSGLGRPLMEAGYGEWGRKMQTDLSDGVRHLVGQGVVDPKRVCIVGASYGGYAALAGATHDPGFYRCAAAFGGVSDLRRQVLYSRRSSGQFALRYWTRFMGAENPGDPVLEQYSPAAHAGRSQIPVLLVHGRDDTVVPLEQSRVMADALTKAGKPVELVVLPGEDHWLTRGETRLKMLEAMVAFIEKHNPPR